MKFLSPQSFIFFRVYFMFNFLLLCSDSFFLFWVLIEFRTLLFMGSCYSVFKNNFSCILLFFIIQSLAAFLLLISYLTGLCFLFSFAILLKLAIFPFYFWYLNLVLSFPNLIIFLARTIFKIPSFIIISYFSRLLNFDLLIMSAIFTILVGGLVIIYSNELRLLLVSSSIVNNSWFFFSIKSRVFLFFLFFVVYFLCLIFIMYYIGMSSSVSSGGYLFSDLSYGTCILFVLVVMRGLPPMPLFFIKAIIFYYLVFDFYHSYLIFIILISVVVSMLGYLKFIFRSFINYYSYSGLYKF